MIAHPTYKWSSLVHKVVENYNNTIHSTTGFTPAYLLFGKDRHNTSSLPLSVARTQAVERSDTFKAKKKVEYDHKHKAYEFSIGDLVKRRVPHNHPELKKLSPRFDAPFKVVTITGPVTAHIQRIQPSNGLPALKPIADPILVHIGQLEPHFHRISSSEGGRV